MIEFIDKTSERAGTPIDRAHMMALQGFIAKTTVTNPDGSITETYANGHTLTTKKNADGSITETLVGEKTIIKTTRFNGNVITEEVGL